MSNLGFGYNPPHSQSLWQPHGSYSAWIASEAQAGGRAHPPRGQYLPTTNIKMPCGCRSCNPKAPSPPDYSSSAVGTAGPGGVIGLGFAVLVVAAVAVAGTAYNMRPSREAEDAAKVRASVLSDFTGDNLAPPMSPMFPGVSGDIQPLTQSILTNPGSDFFAQELAQAGNRANELAALYAELLVIIDPGQSRFTSPAALEGFDVAQRTSGQFLPSAHEAAAQCLAYRISNLQSVEGMTPMTEATHPLHQAFLATTNTFRQVNEVTQEACAR